MQSDFDSRFAFSTLANVFIELSALGSVCLQESEFLLNSEFIKMFGCIMKNELENNLLMN